MLERMIRTREEPEEQPTPMVSTDLLEHLESRFRDVCPDGEDPMEWWNKQGEVRVVRYLRRLHDKQRDNRR